MKLRPTIVSRKRPDSGVTREYPDQPPRRGRAVNDEQIRVGALGLAARSGKSFEWTGVVLVFALIVQQGAFISVSMVLQDVSLAGMRESENPVNTVCVALSLLLVGAVCLYRAREIASIARTNLLPVSFLSLVVLSTIWSIHPALTIRRSVGYLLSMVVAAYLPARFKFDDIMRLLSLSFTISALGSICFVAVSPQYGIMQEGELAGTWQGVFPHKEILGSVMTVAVFVELYNLVAGAGRQRWRFCLLAMYLALIVLSGAKTALLVSLGYAAGTCVYLLWRRHPLLGMIASTAVVFTSAMLLMVFMSDPEGAFGVVGKDPTLTGRTEVWKFVTELISQKPILGWGYRALWQPDDPITAHIDDFVGWSVPSSHNAFLEIALQLGWTGVTLMALMICVALRRAAKCCAWGLNPLGWFSAMFFVGTVLSGLTLETLGQNQVIEWVVFNVLFFSCGVSFQAERQKSVLMGRKVRTLERQVCSWI